MDMVESGGGYEASPCSRCHGSPCCRHLPLWRFAVDGASDWERLESLADVPGIRTALKDDGMFQVYLERNCAYLSPSGMCGVHGDPRQSAICRDFPANTCWYFRAFRADAGPSLVLLDGRRIDALGAMLRWDADGRLDSAPPWPAMEEALGSLPLDGARLTAGPIEPDRAVPAAADGEPPVLLLVPPGRPERREQFPLIRFRLGFPGVSLLAGPGPWAFLVSPPGFDFLSPHRVWDPFGTGADPAASRRITLADLDAFEARCRFSASGRFLGDDEPLLAG